MSEVTSNFSSAEVSSLRSAAANAVAEFNDPLGAQLTDPDKSDEIDPNPKPSMQSGSDMMRNNILPGPSSRPETSSLTGLDNNTIFTQHGCPPHGAKAIMGRRPRMEDAFTAVPFLLEVIFLSVTRSFSALCWVILLEMSELSCSLLSLQWLCQSVAELHLCSMYYSGLSEIVDLLKSSTVQSALSHPWSQLC